MNEETQEKGRVVAYGGSRLALKESDWLDDWYVPWSPRNHNNNGEGPWSHWVELAREIIKQDEAKNKS